MTEQIPMPAAEDWHTAKQACVALPWLTERTLKTFVEKNNLRYSKRGSGATAPRLFKLADINAVIDQFAGTIEDNRRDKP